MAEGAREAATLLPILARRISEERDAGEVLMGIVESGQAVGWIAGRVRSEMYVHGLLGERYKDDSEQIMTASQLTTACQAIIARIVRLKLRALADLPHPSSVLWLWLDVAPDDARGKLASWMARPRGFLDGMEALSTRITSSSGSFLVIKKSNLEYFLEPEPALERLRGMTEHRDKSVAARAVELLERFVTGSSY